ncbi:hypothetical protein [Caballeronia mineralivorans]|nr:hypothetical protein [Caballeronia mineralivorans]
MDKAKLPDAQPSLGDFVVVDRLIRDFTVETLGLLGHQDFMARLDFECRRMNSLFLGIIPSDQYLTGPWNAPDQLGEYILKALVINGKTRLAVRDAFMWFFDKVLDTYEPGDKFEPTLIQPLIDELRDALLGESKGSQDHLVRAD